MTPAPTPSTSSTTTLKDATTKILEAIDEVKDSKKAYNGKWRTAKLSTIHNSVIELEKLALASSTTESNALAELRAKVERRRAGRVEQFGIKMPMSHADLVMSLDKLWANSPTIFSLNTGKRIIYLDGEDAAILAEIDAKAAEAR